MKNNFTKLEEKVVLRYNADFVERVATFFNLNKENLLNLPPETDLYSKISELTGIERNEIKRWMHGFAYSVGPKHFKFGD